MLRCCERAHVAIAFALTAIACVPGAVIDPIALQSTSDGGIHVRIGPCGTEPTAKIELLGSADPADTPERQLWSIAARPAVLLREFRVGEVPEGFQQEMELASVPRDHALAVRVTGESGSVLVADFRLSQLRRDRVWYGNRLVSLASFRKDACRPD